MKSNLATPLKRRVPTAFKELYEPHRIKCYWGGRGAGKSVQMASALLLKGTETPKRILCAREIQRSIKDSVHSLLASRIEALGLERFYEVTQNEIRGVNGTTFIFTGLLANIQSIKSIDNIDLCWVEEASSVSENSWRTLIPSIRKPGSEIWVSFNPEHKTDAAYQRFVLYPPQNAMVKKVSYRDNPYFSQTTLPEEMQILKDQNEEEYLHVYEGELKQFVDGSIYRKQLQQARDEGRICWFPVESLEVHTFWDLGRNDSTAIWFMQSVNGKELRFIDYYEHRLVDLDHYAHVLKEKGYLYGTHYLPHDVEVISLGSNNRSRRDILEGLGVHPITTVPRIASVEDGIAMVRDKFKSCWFHEKTEQGLEALSNYQYQFDEKHDTYRKVPLHNAASNGADAFRMFAQAFEEDTYIQELDFASEW